ncbi:hypothetical protein [Actinokineospora sp. NBRC 105648]|uniref:hypothetical protein n=1 Tax=Actinokineospora sp. NBRC 105648 TaxID=3032206 RepID=UPI0024A1ECE1|nr:hypothetical protein [Actinokineospora sp. NBRC 105648]GLZ43590.1 hypothetical protein Acsp05_72140 [Actinokineospora sp. NBRC 105648]
MVNRRGLWWCQEDGAGYDVREYNGGKPTGLHAISWWHADAFTRVRGSNFWLLGLPDRIVIADQADAHGARTQIPRAAWVDAHLVDDPGQPRVRLDLTVTLAGVPVTLPLWFNTEHRDELLLLVDEVGLVRDSPGGGPRHALPHAPGPSAVAPPEPAAPPPVDTAEPRAAKVVAARTEPGEVPLLAVRVAPCTDDWVVFRPGECSDEVLDPVRAQPPAAPLTGAR